MYSKKKGVDEVADAVKGRFLDRELYLECLGHFSGLEFVPRSGLKIKPPSAEDERFRKPGTTSDTISNGFGEGPETAKLWRKGALTNSLRRLGFTPRNSKRNMEGIDPDTFRRLSPFLMKYKSVEPHISVFRQDETSADSPVNGLIDESLNNNENRLKEFSKLPKMDRKRSREDVSSDVGSRSNKRPLFNFTSGGSTSLGGNESSKCDAVIGSSVEPVPGDDPSSSFRTAYQQLLIDDKQKGVKRKFVPPTGLSSNVKVSGLFRSSKPSAPKQPPQQNMDAEPSTTADPELTELMSHESLKCFESKIVEAILSEIMQPQQNLDWNDIAGLDHPKDIIKEVIIWPMLRPDIFTGLRESARGILLFGPPGTGKTMIGRLIASKSKSTFFNISASSVMSKWIGDGEKLVRALFAVARIKQPSVIFIDEIDSILTQRSDSEHESSRRLKTEFLIQFDGCNTKSEDRVLVIGVTNRPQELDEAARRRMTKRIYIPLPDSMGRKQLLTNLLSGQNAELDENNINKITEMTDGYSGADIKSLCQDAAYGPLRDIVHMLDEIDADKVRPIQMKDFLLALKRVKPSVATSDLTVYENWDATFGCRSDNKKE